MPLRFGENALNINGHKILANIESTLRLRLKEMFLSEMLKLHIQ